MKNFFYALLSLALLTSCASSNNRKVASNYLHGDVITKVRFIENFLSVEANTNECMNDLCKYIEISSLNDTYLTIKSCTVPFKNFKNIGDTDNTLEYLKSNFSGQTCTSYLDNHLITNRNRAALDQFIADQPFKNKSKSRKYMIATGSFIAGACVAILAIATAPASFSVALLAAGGASGLAASGTATIANSESRIGRTQFKESDLEKLSQHINENNSHLILIGEQVDPNLLNKFYNNNSHYNNFERNIKRFSQNILNNSYK